MISTQHSTALQASVSNTEELQSLLVRIVALLSHGLPSVAPPSMPLGSLDIAQHILITFRSGEENSALRARCDLFSALVSPRLEARQSPGGPVVRDEDLVGTVRNPRPRADACADRAKKIVQVTALPKTSSSDSKDLRCRPSRSRGADRRGRTQYGARDGARPAHARSIAVPTVGSVLAGGGRASVRRGASPRLTRRGPDCAAIFRSASVASLWYSLSLTSTSSVPEALIAGQPCLRVEARRCARCVSCRLASTVPCSTFCRRHAPGAGRGTDRKVDRSRPNFAAAARPRVAAQAGLAVALAPAARRDPGESRHSRTHVTCPRRHAPSDLLVQRRVHRGHGGQAPPVLHHA